MLRHIFLCVFVYVGVLGYSSPVFSEDNEIVEEIIVTATHRETELMQTPQAISAVTGEMIEELGVTDMKQLFKNIPGLNMVEAAGAGRNQYIVRGVSSQGGDLSYMQSFSAISVFVDNVPMSSAQGPAKQFGGNLFDMERVEVLKGPQGTLYGEGAVGGSIRFIQNKPQLDETDWKIRVGTHKKSHSDSNGHRVDGMVNFPLGERAAMRLVGFKTEEAGWIDKTNMAVQDDFNTESSDGGRVSLLWAEDRWSVQGTFYSVNSETEGNFFGGGGEVYEEAQNYRIPGSPPVSWEEVDIFALDYEYEFDSVTMEIMLNNMDRSNYRMNENASEIGSFFDWFIQFNILTRAADRPNEIPQLLAEGWQFDLAAMYGNTNQIAFNTDDLASSDRDTFGLRFLSNSDSNVQWLAGLFYKNSDDYRRNVQPALYQPRLDNATFMKQVYNEFYSDPSNTHQDSLEEKSIFGEVTWGLSDTVDATIGLRYTDMKQMIDDSLSFTEDTVLSPKLNLSWQATDETLAYFNYGTGFRPGNVNLGQEFNVRQLGGAGDAVIPSTPFAANPAGLTGTEAAALALSRTAYDGDEVTNYELGVKTTLADGRVRLIGNFYYFDWQDTILVFQDPNIPSINKSYQDNAGAAHSMGIEGEISAQLMDNLTMNISFDINEAELDEAVMGSPKGTPLPNAPEWSFNIMLDYGIPLENGHEINFLLNHSQLASQKNALGVEDAEGTVVFAFEFPDRQQTDLTVNYRGSNDTWRFSLYGRNLTGEHEVVGFADLIGISTYGWQAPRQIGLEFMMRAD